MDGTSAPEPERIAEELAAAGFVDAREIGRGGFGVVYRCYQTSLARSVAAKVVGSDIDQNNRERFLREGYAMGGLSGHPNIMHVLQVGVTASNRLYIVMPYYASDSLAQRLRRTGPIQWPEALQIGVKLCGALETAHRTNTLHRDIKPANVLVNDYGEPVLSDFGLAHITGGFQTATGHFTGTISYTAPEVLTGAPPTVAADIYSLAATIYALLAGNAAHERQSGEDLLAHYQRVSSRVVPDLRPAGIPDNVCTPIERAMSLDPAKRPASAEEFGRELQAAERENGLAPVSMALSVSAGETRPYSMRSPSQRSRLSETTHTSDTTAATETTAITTGRPSREVHPPPPAPPSSMAPTQMRSLSEIGPLAGAPRVPPVPPGAHQPTEVHATSEISSPSGPGAPPVPSGGWVPPVPQGGAEPVKKAPNRRLLVWGAVAAVVVLLVGAGLVFLLTRHGGGSGTNNAAPAAPAAEVQAGWQPITNARIERDAVATTQADGTVWIFGGLGPDGAVSANHEGYDPAIDSWKGGDNLPVPVQHAMSVTWQDNPIVLGGWRSAGPNPVASDQVWRVVNGRWVELPRLLQPRAAAAAAVVGERIIVTGGVGANGALLNTTEIFDGNTWTLGAPIPTPRQMLAAASDTKLLYAVGGSTGTAELPTVEAYDPAANSWAPLPNLAQPRSDLGVAIADGRLVAVGGISAGQVLKSVAVFDLAAKSWAGLPDMATPRHGMAVAAVNKSVYAIGGSTEIGDARLTSTAEALKLAPRKLQPAPQWRTLPDAPTARLMMAGTVLDGKIWVIGGLKQGTALQIVQSYDPQTGSWQSEPPLPIPLHHAVAVSYRGEVVVIGGASDDIAQASNKVFVLRGNTWQELPSLKHARAAPGAGVIGDKIVVVGGQNNKQIVAQTEVYDGKSWTDAPDLPTPREHLAAVSDGTYLYAIGGRFLSADKNSAAFDRFDPATNTWTALVDMPTPRGSYGATYIDGRIVAVGGEDPTQVLDAAEMYDIAAGKWTKLAPLPTARHAEVVAAVANTVYVIGGANRPTHQGPVATIEALDFT
jgi:serine/threonine-protein kinase PknK